MYFAQNLTKLMKDHDMTILELSRRTGIPKSTIHNWMYGVKPNDLTRVIKIAELFKKETNVLLLRNLSFKILS